MSQVDKRFLNSARRLSWKYEIAREYGISPTDVAEWDGEDVMEALADIADRRARAKNRKGGKKP